MLYTFYRISDGGNPNKKKLHHATKMHCLDNFIKEFGNENMIVFADNCSESTLCDIKERNPSKVLETDLGNAKACLLTFTYAARNLQNDDIVYFVEDDFLHLPGAKTALLEGIEIADYVTLYDHPDKYMGAEIGGPNCFVTKGGEITKVLLTKSRHWKYTCGTVMTMAARLSTIKEDFHVWEKFPAQSFKAWQCLQNLSPQSTFNFPGWLYRKLVSPIPSLSTHVETDWLAPFINWENV